MTDDLREQVERAERLEEHIQNELAERLEVELDALEFTVREPDDWGVTVAAQVS